MIGSRLRGRRSGAILAATLLIIAAVPGVVTAANSRNLWIGSPDAQTNANQLLASTVSVPAADTSVNSTVFLVQIKSTDNQTIAHTILTVNANFRSNAGLTLNSIYDPNGGADANPCAINGSVITCDYGNLGAFGQHTIAVVVDVAPTYVAVNQVTPLFWARVTTNNENGSNQQLFTADSGTFAVSAFNADKLNTFVPPGQSRLLFTSPVGGTNTLQSKVNFATTGGKIVSMNEGTSTNALYRCPTGLSCQPLFSEVTAGDGAFPTSPYFTWTLTAIVPKTYNKSQGFVAHYPTGATNADWILLFKNSSSLCGTNLDAKIAAQGHCISALSVTKIDRDTQLLVVTLVMDHQGGMKI